MILLEQEFSHLRQIINNVNSVIEQVKFKKRILI